MFQRIVIVHTAMDGFEDTYTEEELIVDRKHQRLDDFADILNLETNLPVIITSGNYKYQEGDLFICRVAAFKNIIKNSKKKDISQYCILISSSPVFNRLIDEAVEFKVAASVNFLAYGAWSGEHNNMYMAGFRKLKESMSGSARIFDGFPETEEYVFYYCLLSDNLPQFLAKYILVLQSLI